MDEKMKAFFDSQLKARIRQTGTDPKDKEAVAELLKKNMKFWAEMYVYLGN